jgi:heptosyltransferase-1
MTATPGDVLLVRLSAIGDVVHTLPVAAALNRRGWRVSWIVEPAARPLLEGNPAVTQVVAAPPARAWRIAAVRAAAKELRRTRREAALDLQGLWKSAGWARLAGAARAIGFAPRWRREPLSSVLLTEQALLGPEARARHRQEPGPPAHGRHLRARAAGVPAATHPGHGRARGRRPGGGSGRGRTTWS